MGQTPSVHASTEQGVAVDAGSSGRSVTVNPSPPPAAAVSSYVLDCYRRGLWQANGSALLNDKFTWDVMTRAGVWSFSADESQPAGAGDRAVEDDADRSSADAVMLSKGFLDRMEAVDCLAERGWAELSNGVRSELSSRFLKAYYAMLSGDDTACSSGTEIKLGISVFEAVLSARKTLLAMAHAALSSQQPPVVNDGNPSSLPYATSSPSYASHAEEALLGALSDVDRLALESAVVSLVSHIRCVSQHGFQIHSISVCLFVELCAFLAVSRRACPRKRPYDCWAMSLAL